jgi:pimeloyl-ACP methyl ester carboxylesterase
VFFHTGGCGDGRMWELAGYTKALAGCRAILFDHRGHGLSDCPEGVESHHIEEYVADVIAVLDAADAEKAVLLGYSSGATTAYFTAAAHPDRCAAVVGLGGIGSPGEDFAGWRPLIDAVRSRGTAATIEAMATGEPEPPPAWLVEHLSSTSTEMFASLMEGWLDAPTEWGMLERITAPTLIVCGEHEDADGQAALAASTMREADAVVLPAFGHLQTFWHTEITAPLIRGFLASKGLLAPLPGGQGAAGFEESGGSAAQAAPEHLAAGGS